jgi:EmrB/QacA subfamily drug resistance transporter
MIMTRYFVFIAVGLSLLLASISNTAVSVAFPVIISTFDTSLILAGWVLTINQLMATAFMPLGGKAGEIFGVKLVYLISLAVFTIGSLLSALAPNIEVLIFGRLIQAVGTGSILPLATTIVSDTFPGSRQKAIGLIGSFFPIGMIIGPNLGGWLVETFGWKSVFWLNIPLGVIVFIILLKLLKPSRGEGGQLDLVGTGFFTGSLSAFLIALSSLGDVLNGASWLLPAALFAAAIVFMIAFLQREGSIKNPVIDLQLLTKKPFLAANIFNLVYGAAALGVMSFVPLFATSVYGMTTLASGLILTPRSVGMVIASILTSLYLPRWGYRWPMVTGTGFIVLGLLLFGLEPSGISIFGIQLSGTFIIGAVLFLIGAGMGITAPAANNACIDLMPERIGTITGVRGMFRQSGSAISIAVTAVVLDYIPDMGRGFMVVYYGLAIIMMMTVPVIFAMPKSAGDLRPVEKTGQPAP